MNSLRVVMVVIAGVLSLGSVELAQAQFYGGSNMGSFAPPHSIGGFYPVPYSTMFPGVVGGNGGYGGYGYGGYGYGGYGGFGGYGPGFGYGGGLGTYAPFGPYAGFPPYPYGGPGNYGWRSPVVPSDAAQAADQGYGVSSQFSQQPANVSLSPQVIHTGANIKLVCPKTANGSLSYWLNGTSYTIQPGYAQNFRDDRTWKLEFQRGGEGSELVGYTLKPGTYNFAVGPSGWELRQVVSATSGDLPPAPQPTPLASPTPTQTSPPST